MSILIRSSRASQLANVPPAKSLALKKGAQVLLLANLNIKRKRRHTRRRGGERAADMPSTEGLVNGSRGVIVDWVDRDLVPLDDKLDSTQAGTTQKRKVAGGAFGGEEWREKAAEEWADKQDAEVFPLVYFATGAQGAWAFVPHSRSGLTILTRQLSFGRIPGVLISTRRTRLRGRNCLCSWHGKSSRTGSPAPAPCLC